MKLVKLNSRDYVRSLILRFLNILILWKIKFNIIIAKIQVMNYIDNENKIV